MQSKFDYFVIFAEMRTGSNFLESNINQFPGLHCYGEAFNPYFLHDPARRLVDPKRHELFGMDQAMRDADPMALITAMTSGTKGLPGFRFFHDHDTRVFDKIIADPRCAKVVLSRNLVESYVSRKIAWETDQWKLGENDTAIKTRITFLADDFERLFLRMKEFQLGILQSLQKTGQTAFYIDYEDIQDLDVINGMATFLGEDHRLEAFSNSFKKQNPEPLADKVKNYDEMIAALGKIDHYDLGRLPNFEARRGPLVPTYVSCPDAPLLFAPIPGGPGDRVRGWMAALDRIDPRELTSGYTQKTLRQWKRRHKGHRSFTVLSHPVARLHNAFCTGFLRPDAQPFRDIRKTLTDIYNVPLPDDVSHKAYDKKAHRAAFIGFAEFVKSNLSGQTSIRTAPAWASQSAIIQGFSNFMLPDYILREDGLEAGLRHVADEVGCAAPALAPEPPAQPFDLSDIYDGEVEAAVRAAYQRDYMMFGFGPWR